MRKITLAALVLVSLAGCSNGSFMGMRGSGDGSGTGIASERAPARSSDAYTTTRYRAEDEGRQYAFVGPYANDRVWPPVWTGQPFPVQDMASE